MSALCRRALNCTWWLIHDVAMDVRPPRVDPARRAIVER
jgi:hypothetical protein